MAYSPVLNPQPVSGTVTANAGTGTMAVSAASLPLPTGAATETTIAAISAKFGALGQTTMAGSTPVTIASNQSALAVTGTFWQATQPVSGTVSISGSVAVTGTFWQATQPVSGTVTANAGTGTFAISAASLPLPTGASTETTLAAVNTKLGAALNVSPDNILDNLTTTGSAGSATTIVSVANTGFNGGSFHVTANAGGNTVTFEQSNDNTNWVPLIGYQPGAAFAPTATTVVTGIFNYSSSAAYVRAKVSTWNSGTTSVSLTQKRNGAVQTPVSLTIGGSSGSLQIGTVAIAGTTPVSGTVNIGNTPGAATSGQTGVLNLGAVTTAAPSYTTTQMNNLSLTTLGGLRSDIASYNSAALTGTVTAYGTAPTGNVFGVNAAVTSGTITTVTTLTTLANGQTAHSAASTGSPVRIGGRVNTAVDTTLVAGDASDVFMTTGGALVQKPYSMPETDWQATSGLTPLATTTSTAVKTAGAAGVRNYVTAIQLVNNSATVSTNVAILDGVTVLWAGWLPATTAALPVVPVNITFPTPLRGSPAIAVNIQLGTTAASVFWNAQGYQAV